MSNDWLSQFENRGEKKTDFNNFVYWMIILEKKDQILDWWSSLVDVSSYKNFQNNNKKIIQDVFTVVIVVVVVVHKVDDH